MAFRLNWNADQIAESLGYLSNPLTNTHIEVQVRPDGRAKFEESYRQATGESPPLAGEVGYSILRQTSDKQGTQKRVYFSPVGAVPPHLSTIMKNAAKDRQRISRNRLVDVMLTHGFLMGTVQANRVRHSLSGAQQAAFDRGYAAANLGGQEGN